MKSFKTQIKRQQAHYEAMDGERPIAPHSDTRKKKRPGFDYTPQNFQVDVDSLSGLPLSEKTVLKKQLVQKYKPQAMEYAKSGNGQNELFGYYVQWQYDIGDFDQYFDLTDIAVAKECRPVVRKNKTFEQCLMYDILEWCELQHNSGRSSEPYLTRYMNRVENWSRIPDKIRQSFWYLKFYDLLMTGKKDKALVMGKEALKEHKAKIKTKLSELFVDILGEAQGKEQWKTFLKT